MLPPKMVLGLYTGSANTPDNTVPTLPMVSSALSIPHEISFSRVPLTLQVFLLLTKYALSWKSSTCYGTILLISRITYILLRH